MIKLFNFTTKEKNSNTECWLIKLLFVNGYQIIPTSIDGISITIIVTFQRNRNGDRKL